VNARRKVLHISVVMIPRVCGKERAGRAPQITNAGTATERNNEQLVLKLIGRRQGGASWMLGDLGGILIWGC
jgi:hypothetical protein